MEIIWDTIRILYIGIALLVLWERFYYIYNDITNGYFTFAWNIIIMSLFSVPVCWSGEQLSFLYDLHSLRCIKLAQQSNS